MNKKLYPTIFWLSLILGTAFYGCTTNMIKTGDVTDITPSVTKVTSSTPPEIGGVTFIPNSKNKDEIMLVTVASDKVNEVVQGKCFSDFLLARDMIQTNGQTNSQVVNKLQSVRGKITVNFYYKRFTSEIAVRYPPSNDINFNQRYWTGNTKVCDWASTLAHEGLGHVLGNYDHDFSYSKNRDYSVPYSINAAFKQCCK